MLRKVDIETDPDYAYEWAEKGIKFERARILKLIEEFKDDNGYINAAWSAIEREINHGTLD